MLATDTHKNSDTASITLTITGQPGYRLYVQGAGDSEAVAANDIVQGGLGDCWFLSVLAGIAQESPQTIRAMILDDGQGNFRVRFFQRNAQNQFTAVWIPVEFNAQGAAGVAIGGDVDPATGAVEIWPRIIEMAFLQFVGGSENVGGYPSTSWEMITGRDAPQQDPISRLNEATLRQAIDQHRLLWVWTNPAPLVMAGLAPNHIYRVIGYDSMEGIVTLENPHGSNNATVRFTDLVNAMSYWWVE